MGNAGSMISGFLFFSFSFVFFATKRRVRVCGDLWGDSGARSCWSSFYLSEIEASASDGRIFFLLLLIFRLLFASLICLQHQGSFSSRLNYQFSKLDYIHSVNFFLIYFILFYIKVISSFISLDILDIGFPSDQAYLIDASVLDQNFPCFCLVLLVSGHYILLRLRVFNEFSALDLLLLLFNIFKF